MVAAAEQPGVLAIVLANPIDHDPPVMVGMPDVPPAVGITDNFLRKDEPAALDHERELACHLRPSSWLRSLIGTSRRSRQRAAALKSRRPASDQEATHRGLGVGAACGQLHASFLDLALAANSCQPHHANLLDSLGVEPPSSVRLPCDSDVNRIVIHENITSPLPRLAHWEPSRVQYLAG